MHTNALASRRFLARRIVGCLPIVALSAATIVAAGCHDAPTGPLGPRTPTLAVSTDGAWLVNSLADPGDGVCSNSECTLREAIAAAQDGDRITFKSNLTGTIALTAGVLDIDKSLTIDGPGPRVLTVDGQNASTVFEIGLPNPVIVIVTGLTVTRGKTAADGGGIRVREQSRLVLIGSVVSGSSAARSFAASIRASPAFRHPTARANGRALMSMPAARWLRRCSAMPRRSNTSA